MDKEFDYAKFALRHAEAEAILEKVGTSMKEICPPGWGFSFFLFEYVGENFFYISSAEREDIIKLLQEFLNKLKGN